MLPKNLLNCNGIKFKCTIDDSETSGIISVEKEIVYLCQNDKKGDTCNNKQGFKYSWSVGDGSKMDMDDEHVKNFELVSSFKPGDRVIIKEGIDELHFGYSSTYLGTKIGTIVNVYEFIEDCKSFKYSVNFDNGHYYSMAEFELLLCSPITSNACTEHITKFRHGDKIRIKSDITKFKYGTVSCMYPGAIGIVSDVSNYISVNLGEISSIWFDPSEIELVDNPPVTAEQCTSIGVESLPPSNTFHYSCADTKNGSSLEFKTTKKLLL